MANYNLTNIDEDLMAKIKILNRIDRRTTRGTILFALENLAASREAEIEKGRK